MADNGDGRYTITPEANYNGQVVLNYSVADGNGGSIAGSQSFTLAAVNDAPVNGVPAAVQILAEDGALAFASLLGNGLSVSDVDVGSGTLTVTLSVDQGGYLTSLGKSFGGQYANVTGSGTPTMAITGTLAEVNASLDTAAFGAAPNFHGDVTLTLASSDLGNTGSPALTDTDTVTLRVTAVNDAPTGSVTISGAATQGQTLTASNTLADIDGLGAVSYQWQANGVDIAGATASILLLGQSQVGKAITVLASYTDGQGTYESVASGATSTVANVNDAPTGTVGISGTAVKGQTLTVTNTLADADGLGIITYQWQADGTNITGATGGSYLLAQADVGKSIKVVTSYTDAWGTAETVSSQSTAPVAQTASTYPGTSTDGDDILQSTTGRGELAGGLGNDTYIINSTGVTIREEPNAGIDQVQSSVTYRLDPNVENLTLTGSTAVNATGNELNNVLIGNNAVNALVGGVGPDTLTGGLGADRFVFSSVSESTALPEGWDLITDFSSAEGDKIDLLKIDLSAQKGRQGFTFSETAEFTATNQLRFDSDTGMLYGNTDADSGAEFAIQLVGVTTMGLGDFLL